ncbi:two-component system chemotaxis response regulator CheB [Sphingobium boeckii]|uniref:protein-glutamate methylesterase n=2 Tax=Sphingobium boeckii TaxID=1082345 RepID=A0A7W9AK41_9SPHN|nr:two-component system chemotaxis response regulator CheB [Sphingobium boeckii]
MVSQNPAFEIVDAVSSAREALALLERETVDVILLDIEMPGRTGISALPDLIDKSRGARVLIVSALAEDGAAATVEALTLGAADTLAKPGRGTFSGKFSEILCERLIRLGQSDMGQGMIRNRAPDHREVPITPAAPHIKRGAVACVAIGASTGGLHAIAEFFKHLPADFTAPILITQHLPAVFMPFFARQIETGSGRRAMVARDGMALEPGLIHIAPGDAHLCLHRSGDRVFVRLSRVKAVSGCLPSVDPMFVSVADIFGDRAVGVVLSGMGRDGTIGAADMAAKGAELLAQDVETSVVWGMPGSIAKAGLATGVMTPGAIARHIGQRAVRA